MRILLINDPGIPVPPKLYGGIERTVYQLAEEYTKLGHEVTLLAGPDSFCSGNSICFGSNNLVKTKWEILKDIFFVWKYLFLNQYKFDLIHSFGRLIYLLPVLNKPVKKIMTYQRDVTVKSIQTIQKFPKKNLHFTGCSDYISQKAGLVGNWQTVYNFVDLSKQEFSDKVPESAPLVFLGRLDKIKGCHHCIKLAKMLNHELIIAGNISDISHEKLYFENEIKPHIDGKLIRYVGPVNDSQKNELLSNAKALLMLLDWDEPFGIVMIEALACGTPVIGFPRGAVKEIVEDGVNGIIIDSLDSIEDAERFASLVSNIDRNQCLESVKSRFELSHVTTQYLNIV